MSRHTLGELGKSLRHESMQEVTSVSQTGVVAVVLDVGSVVGVLRKLSGGKIVIKLLSVNNLDNLVSISKICVPWNNEWHFSERCRKR